MKLLRKILKWFIYFLLIPVSYLLIALILSTFTVNGSAPEGSRKVYLTTNGVHLHIIIPLENLTNELKKDLAINPVDKYLSFGWGEENFYLNTPTWDDLTFANAFSALFVKSPTLIHLTRYQQHRSSWIEINVSEPELEQLNSYITKSFKTDVNGMKIGITNDSYTIHDSFYSANGSYSCFKTCNTWVNTGFKQSGLKACFWTPFDFGLLNKYKN